MTIQENYDLTLHNTFGVMAKAKLFTTLSTEEELQALFIKKEFKENKKLFLGGGSNVLFTKDFDGLVVLNNIKGVEILNENEKSVLIKAMGGENWHDLVLFCVGMNLWGIENLAYIPGSVGATPVQNIGAYGAEIKDVLEEVEVYEIDTGKKRILKNSDCSFGYRDSVFKKEAKGKYFITAIIIKLSKIPKPNTEYKILKEYIANNNLIIESSKDVCDAVTDIRKSKLPDPKIIGNAGSFFKNVFITKEKAEELKNLYGNVPLFYEDENIKIPTGWLVENSGPANGVSWKGYKLGNVGVHEKQALVLVNHGGATGEEIKNFSEMIINSVKQKFGVEISPEVNFV